MNALAQISLYNNLFYVFLGISVLGFVMSFFFFFYFDIPTVYTMMTGKAKKDTIRRMEERNAKGGSLHLKTAGQSGQTGKSGRTDRAAKAKIAYTAPTVPTQPAETAVLQTTAPETTILENEAGRTVLLHGSRQPAAGESPVQPQPSQPERQSFRFQVTETTVVIHTNELI